MMFFKPLPVFHRAVVLPLETMLLSEFDKDCSFTTGSAGARGKGTMFKNQNISENNRFPFDLESLNPKNTG